MKQNKGNPFKSYYVILAICLIVVIICVWKITSELYNDRQDKNYYKSLSDQAEDLNYIKENEIKNSTKAVDSSSNIVPDITADTITDAKTDTIPNTKPDTISDKMPDIIPDSNVVRDNPINTQQISMTEQFLNIDINALKKSIPDIVAWIRCDDTVINYPVVQGTDNDFYLNHLPDGNNSRMGSIFLDYNNAEDFSDLNSIIYGHHMRSGDMFTTLESYREQSFYDEHPTIELYTLNHIYILELFAGYVVDASYETIPISFSNLDEYMKYIDEIKERSTFISNVIIEKNDRIVSLCTCTYSSDNARFIIVGKLTKVIF